MEPAMDRQAMMRTGYLLLQFSDENSSGYELRKANRSHIHWDPLCTRMWHVPNSRIVAVPVVDNGDTGRVSISPQAPIAPPIRRVLPVCATCRDFIELDTDWKHDAACSARNKPAGPAYSWLPLTELSQAGASSGYSRIAHRCAKAICWNQCPVRAECEQYAINARLEFGVWGGYSLRGRPLERKQSA